MNKQLFLLLSLVIVVAALPACRKRTEQPIKDQIETMIDIDTDTLAEEAVECYEETKKKIIKF